MDVKKIVVVVEDVEIAKTALQWTLHNLLRYGDILILLHVFPITKSRNKKKVKLLRLKGFQLALSFYDVQNISQCMSLFILGLNIVTFFFFFSCLCY